MDDRRVRFGIAVLVACACLVGTASADQPPPPVFYSLNSDGSSEMAAWGNGPWSWQACTGPGATDCAPFGSGQSIGTGTAPPGTVFVATSSDHTATSPEWQGNVVSMSQPGVEGAVRANAEVTPTLGTWTGGWASSVGTGDTTQLAACAKADGTGCTSLTDDGYIYGCPRGGAVIDPLFTGWYLRVADRRYQSNYPSTLIMIVSWWPYGAPIWQAGPTTSVAVVGRIGPAIGPRVTSCGGPPLPATADPHHLNSRCRRSGSPGCAIANISSTGITRIWCTCSMLRVRVGRGRRAVAFTPNLLIGPRRPAPLTFPLPRSVHKHFGRGPITVSVYNGRYLLTRRRITLS